MEQALLPDQPGPPQVMGMAGGRADPQSAPQGDLASPEHFLRRHLDEPLPLAEKRHDRPGWAVAPGQEKDNFLFFFFMNH